MSMLHANLLPLHRRMIALAGEFRVGINIKSIASFPRLPIKRRQSDLFKFPGILLPELTW